jgi:hypothetical protein
VRPCRAGLAWLLSLLLLLSLSSAAAERPMDAAHQPASATQYPDQLSYNRHIRPLLADKCFGCHGGTLSIAKGGLLLNNLASATGADGGPVALLPGNSEDSELVKRINSDDPEYHMPPPESHKQLSVEQKAALARWIDQGAVYEPHWAYTGPVAQAIPTRGYDNPVDNFLADAQWDTGLEFASPAAPETLVRRLYLDLLGLPPNRVQHQAALVLLRENRLGELVDQLLDSPHFGERMAVNWLDWVRYADSIGYQSDNFRSVYPYRDYVVDAFNGNKPFDEFTREQLAGDLLQEQPSESQIIASGYNMLAMVSEEGGIQEGEYLARYAADRLVNVSATWLAATLECAQCHDHKFDPYLAQDYYSMAAFFSDIDEEFRYVTGYWPWTYVNSPGYQRTVAALEAELAALDLSLLERSSAFQREQLWMDLAAQPDLLSWQAMEPMLALAGQDGRMRLSKEGFVHNRDRIAEVTYRVDFAPANRQPITGLRMRISAPSDFRKLAVADNRVIISEIEVQEISADGELLRRLPLVRGESEVNSRMSPAQLAVDGRPDSSWRILQGSSVLLDSASLRLVADYEFLKPYFFSDFARLVSYLPQSWQRAIWADLEAAILSGAEETGLVAPPEDAPVEVLRKGDNDLRDFVYGDSYAEGVFHFAEAVQLAPGAELRLTIRHLKGDNAVMRFAVDQTSAPLPLLDFATLRDDEDAMNAYLQRAAAADPLLLSERDRLLTELRYQRSHQPNSWIVRQRDEPRDTRVLPRGDWQDHSGDLVQPGAPLVFGEIEARNGLRADRLDLANWLVAESNPLTSRVIVNRLWALMFGEGIVASQQDFGTQGAWPDNQALLDWLAVKFRESGWDVKGLLRLLTTSVAYRQSTEAGVRTLELDPKNRLLTRQRSWRLYAEFIRDSQLQLAGLLEPRLGGPDIRVAQPEHYWKNLRYPERLYNPSQGSEKYRRGLYMHTQRTFPHPALKVFGATGRTEHVSARSRVATPLQALALLNSPTAVEAARYFSERILGEGGEDWPQRLQWAWLEAYGRQPASGEIELFMQQVSGVAPNEAPNDRELALVLARALMNTEEFVTRP